VRLLRTLPAPRLLILIAALVALVTGGAVVGVAASTGEGAKPAPKPLANALHDALTAPRPAGVTARVTFTNNLLPSGALFGNAGSALLSGASGRLWLTNDGRGRIELQSDAGDVQIVWNKTAVSVYDASSNTVYKLALPATKTKERNSETRTPPTVAQISDFLTKLARHLDVSGANPMTVAGRPAYGASLSPKAIGGLLGSVRLAWDARQGVPLSVGVYAKGSTAPALKLSVTRIAYGSVPASNVDLAPPAGAKVVDLGTLTGKSGREKAKPKPVTGLDAVRAAAGFDVVAPDTIGGLQRTNALLVGGKQVLVVYGEGPGAIVVAERKADPARARGGLLTALPPVSLGGVTGHELTTQLGTLIEWQRGGVTYVLAGSVPSATAETAARDVK
jgi:outer membrane lipoprotein-sorting protein